MPSQIRADDPAPCAEVDLAAGERRGHAVLKDLVGTTQYLLIPTARVTGIESPELLETGAPNYFTAAWQARTFVEERAGSALPREWMSLAINSVYGRSQDQLHVHVDCASADVHAALLDRTADIGPRWAPFPVPLAGHRYDAIRVADLGAVDPVVLLADGVAGAREDMGARTLVVVGSTDAAGNPDFVILTDRADPATGNLAEGEELQDHESCRRIASTLPGK